LLITEHCK